MTFLILSFIAGLLTVLAPCILPLLPVIIGGSVSEGERDPYKAYIITGSLAVSVVLFTLLLKASTVLIDIPLGVWQGISGTILILFGLSMVFPGVWERFSSKFNLGGSSNKLLAQGVQKKSRSGDILIGAALGPVFTSCSPTYFVIFATILPASFLTGFVYLVAFAAGLSIALLAIALLGQKFVGKLGKAADPHGWFKRSLGVIFLLVGVAIMTGYDKKFETYLIDKGFGATSIEQKLLKQIEN